MAEGVRVLREKADDTNVRLSSVTQELESMRQTIASMPAPRRSRWHRQRTAAAGDATAAPAGSRPRQSRHTRAGPAPSDVSPQKMYDNAFADYTAGQCDLAILGFQTYIHMFPKTDKADDAQLNIGNSLYAAGKYREAVDAYQKVITNYPQTDSVPAAYCKMGLTYEATEAARSGAEGVRDRHPEIPDGAGRLLAKQRLDN